MRVLNKLLVVMILCFSSSLFSQQWVAKINGTSNGDDKAYAIVTDSLGNIYVAGYTTNVSSGIDMLVAKFNSEGVLQWSRPLNGPGNSEDKAYAVVVDKALNVYIAGYSTGIGSNHDFTTSKISPSGVLLWFQRYNAPGNGDDEAKSLILDDSANVYVTGTITISNTEIYTIKYNTNGVYQWGQVYSGPGNDEDKAYAIIVDAARNIYVAGSSIGFNTGSDYILLKYNLNGVSQWTRRYSGPGNESDKAYAITLDRLNNPIITGESYDTLNKADFLTIKYNSAGDTLWTSRKGCREFEDKAYAIIVDSIGNIYVAGSSMTDTSTGSEDLLAVKYNSEGDTLWTARYDGLAHLEDIPTCMTQNKTTKNVFIAGYNKVDSASQITDDILALRFSGETGQRMQFTNYHGNAGLDDKAYAITIDKFGNVYTTGYVTNLLTSADIFIAKYPAGDLIGIQTISTEVPETFTLYQNYPNPFNPTTKIKFDVKHQSVVSIKVFDVAGREVSVLVNDKFQPGTYEIDCNFSRFASGVYFYQLLADGYINVKKMILVK
jgi:uncharacterized delta-60 repeat protein